MSAGVDAKARQALSKVRCIDLDTYSMFYLLLVNVFWVFLDFGDLSKDLLQSLVILLYLPGLVCITIHFYIITTSLGTGARRIKNKSLSQSVQYFLIGGFIAIVATVLVTALLITIKQFSYLREFLSPVSMVSLVVYAATFRRGLVLLWIWVTEYARTHPGEAGAFVLFGNHPRSKLIKPAFQAVFGEGAIRERAAEKLAFLATYQIPREKTEFDEGVQAEALEIAPERVPLGTRDVTNGKCPNCGAPVPSPTARYCTGCGETFKGSW